MGETGEEDKNTTISSCTVFISFKMSVNLQLIFRKTMQKKLELWKFK